MLQVVLRRYYVVEGGHKKKNAIPSLKYDINNIFMKNRLRSIRKQAKGVLYEREKKGEGYFLY